MKSNIDTSVILDELRAGSQAVDLGPLLDAVRQSATRTDDKLTILQQAVGGIRTSIDFSPVLAAIKKLRSEVVDGPALPVNAVKSLEMARKQLPQRSSVLNGGSHKQRLTLAESAEALARQAAAHGSRLPSEASDSESPSESKPLPQKLRVAIIKAKGLKHLNTFRADEFYVVCTVKHSDRLPKPTMCQTKAVKSTDPTWDETHLLEPWTDGEALEFAIYDKGMLPGCDKTEAMVEISSDRFFPKGFWGDLQLPGVSNATVTVGITPVTGSASSLTKVPPPTLLVGQPLHAEGKAELKYAPSGRTE